MVASHYGNIGEILHSGKAFQIGDAYGFTIVAKSWWDMEEKYESLSSYLQKLLDLKHTWSNGDEDGELKESTFEGYVDSIHLVVSLSIGTINPKALAVPLHLISRGVFSDIIESGISTCVLALVIKEVTND